MENKPPKPPLSDRQRFGLVLAVSSLLAASTVGGYLLGYLVDKWWQTEPYLTIVFTVAGAASGIIQVYRVGRRLIR